MSITSYRRALLVVLAALALIPAAASAQMRDRAERWEGTLQTRYAGSYTVNSADGGSSAALGSAFGLGFGFAYNFTNKWSTGFDFSWASQENTYTGGATTPSGAPTVTNATAYSSTLQINGTYNFIDGPITPYVTGFIGGTYYDSGVPDGVSNGCYWYYYGYACGNYVYTKTGSYFTYGAGAGVRWDVNDTFFIKGGVQQQWYDIGGADGTPNITIGRLDFGMMF